MPPLRLVPLQLFTCGENAACLQSKARPLRLFNRQLLLWVFHKNLLRFAAVNFAHILRRHRYAPFKLLAAVFILSTGLRLLFSHFHYGLCRCNFLPVVKTQLVCNQRQGLFSHFHYGLCRCKPCLWYAERRA